MPRRYVAGSSSGVKKRTRRVQPVDQAALTELDLYAENTGELYPQKQAIIANLQRKKKAGKYDPEKAPKLWLYWVDEAARRYVREFGGPGNVAHVFSKPTRLALAAKLAKEYENGE